MRLTLVSDDQVVGVPQPPAERQGAAELDNTGYLDAVTIGGVAVALSDVTEASIERPPLA